jgi:hypothetical protein
MERFWLISKNSSKSIYDTFLDDHSSLPLTYVCENTKIFHDITKLMRDMRFLYHQP